MNLIKNALANIKSHKLRTFVAIIWIIIGITSVIVISSIGKGLEYKIGASVEKVSNKQFTVSFEPDNYMMQQGSGVYLSPFTLQDIEEISFMEGISKVSKSSDQNMNWSNTMGVEIFYDNKATWLEVAGSTIDDKNRDKYQVTYGRNFAIEDMERDVILITMQAATELFEDPAQSIGKPINISGKPYEVIGVIEERTDNTSNGPQSFFDNIKNSFDSLENGESPMMDYWYLTGLMPKQEIEDMQGSFGYNDEEIYNITVHISSGYDFYDVSSRVVEKLQDNHDDLDGSYMASDPSEMLMEFEYIKDMLNKFVQGITLISLFVGGVGIMNVMYVAVMERQREIGIRRAIGAKPFTIMFQFLVESVFITVVGGIIGIVVGVVVTVIVSGYLPFPAKIDPSVLSFALFTSVLTGIVFGVIPAFKASRLDPIEAITR